MLKKSFESYCFHASGLSSVVAPGKPDLQLAIIPALAHVESGGGGLAPFSWNKQTNIHTNKRKKTARGRGNGGSFPRFGLNLLGFFSYLIGSFIFRFTLVFSLFYVYLKLLIVLYPFNYFLSHGCAGVQNFNLDVTGSWLGTQFRSTEAGFTYFPQVIRPKRLVCFAVSRAGRGRELPERKMLR